MWDSSEASEADAWDTQKKLSREAQSPSVTQGSSGGTHCTGCESLGGTSCMGMGGAKREKSPLWQTIQPVPLVQTFTELRTPAEQNNLMSLLFSFPYCLLRTKCNFSGQGKNPILIRSFIPQTFKLCPVPQNECKTLYKSCCHQSLGDLLQIHRKYLMTYYSGTKNGLDRE